MPQRTLSHYRLIRKIGEGGMGEVYLAEDTSLKREVAVKFLPESVRDDPERLKRFRTEAEAAAKLNHPNIATVHSIEDSDGELFITMEYVDGEPLSSRIGSQGVDIEQLLAWFLPLTDALAHAHEQGLVHRDLKPANIVIRKDGTPIILDFGLARIQTPGVDDDSEAPTRNVTPGDPADPPSLTAAGALLGTPAYMSPEQIEGEKVDARTDLFSMGIVMYETLTGKRPFQGATVESIIARILEVEPEPVTVLKPVTPYSLWSTIRRCLKKDRELRLPTARILHEELRDVEHEIQSGTVLVDASTVSPSTTSRSSGWAALIMICTLAAGFLPDVFSPRERPMHRCVSGKSQFPGSGASPPTALRKFLPTAPRLLKSKEPVSGFASSTRSSREKFRAATVRGMPSGRREATPSATSTTTACTKHRSTGARAPSSPTFHSS